jgi:hypothetical protein
MQLNSPLVKTIVSMSEYTHEKLYVLNNVFLNSLSDQKSIDPAKPLRYAEDYYKFSQKKIRLKE